MNTHLTINDPLANREVTIVITLAAGEQPRAERPALISVGVAPSAASGQVMQLPVIKTGTLGDVWALINAAWTAFGVRAQAAAAAAEAETVDGEQTAVEEQVVATADIDADEPNPTTPPKLTPPQPQAKNLSLF